MFTSNCAVDLVFIKLKRFISFYYLKDLLFYQSYTYTIFLKVILLINFDWILLETNLKKLYYMMLNQLMLIEFKSHSILL